MSVLDAGCGIGIHLPLLARRVGPDGSVTGLDIDMNRLAVAEAACADYVAEGWIRLQQGDIAALPLPDDLFDVGWSSLVLHHFDGMRGLVAELVRVVRPGGIVAVFEGDHHASFPILPWPADFELRLRGAILGGEEEHHDGRLPPVPSGYVARYLPQLLRQAGLAEIRIHAVSDVYNAPLESEQEVLIRDWLLSWFDRRARAWLDPEDWEQIVAYLGSHSPDYLLGRPDFFVSGTWFLTLDRAVTKRVSR